ncbi:MAG: hypothetical protein ACHQKY_07960 [Terriglobia bacterium]
MTIDEKPVSVAVVCSFCRSSFALPASTKLRFDPQWQRTDELQVLVDRTNPALGRVQQRVEPSVWAVLALLRSLEDQRRNFTELLEDTSGREVGLGALLGGILFAVLGNLLVSLGPHKVQAWSAYVSFVIAPAGLAIGALVGGIFGGLRIARNQIAEQIKTAMSFYSIRFSQLREALAREPERLSRVRSIIETIAQTGSLAR